MRERLNRYSVICGALLLGLLMLALFMRADSYEWEFKVSDEAEESTGSGVGVGAFYCEAFIRRDDHKILHSPSLVRVTDDRAILIWYEGSSEGAEDVRILSAEIERGKAEGCWSAGGVKEVMSAGRLQEIIVPHQKVDVLGNAVAVLDREENTVRYYITFRSFGGWSFVKVAALAPDLESARVVSGSGFFGRSVAVRGNAVEYTDGTYGLPVYHEILANFAEFLRVTADARVIAKARISKGFNEIQPWIVVLDERRAMAFMRNYKVKRATFLKSSLTEDGGRSWGKLQATSLPNPNSPVAGVSFGDGSMALVFNDHVSERDILALALSDDGGDSWRRTRVLEKEIGDVRYPSFINVGGDGYMLAYSIFDKRGIKVILMNERWIRGE